MLKEFKQFVLRGNVVDLAVAVVIGAAFSGLVSAFVRDFLNPLIGAVQGHVELAKYTFKLHNIVFPYGDFLNTLITFMLTALVVFLFVVQPINHLMEIANRTRKTPSPTTYKCPHCLAEIPLKATRCQFCTSRLEPPVKAASAKPAA